MRLTARSEYGLLALIELACRYGSGPVSVREIADRQGIPPKFLGQLFVALRKAGLVRASRGARGGFELGVDPADVSVLSVVEALEGPLSPTMCQSERGALCGRSGACAAGAVWGDAASALRDVFASAMLADLAGEQSAFDASAVSADGRV